MKRIRVRLVRIDGEVEVSMDVNEFEASDISIDDDVRALKDSYNEMIRTVKPMLSKKPSTTKRWRACRKMSEFVDNYTKFDVTNFTTACARDMESGANFRLLILFGREFSENEVYDSIPYTAYRTLILKKNKLARCGIYETEKAQLVYAGETACSK